VAARVWSAGPAMIFTTPWFLLFVAVVVVVFWLLRRPAWRLGWLATACVIFHAHFAGPAGVLPIVVLMIITFFAGRSRRPAACLTAMIACVAALCFYKYALFLIGSLVAPLSAGLSATLSRNTRGIMPGAPPLAVSFFVFEFVHYLFEVRKGGEPIRSPLKFLLFAIFFPSLVAGPIKRYTQFLPSLEAAARARASSEEFAAGLRRVALGFFKKVIVADNLTLYIDAAQPNFAGNGLFERWFVLAAIALRILLDFSGYSDIAIGTAQLLGVRLPENFNWPYAARDLQDFWQRWHISLSSWIRDYVYIPLGGSRHGVMRRGFNVFVAFALCGLWHGPAWHFMLWGIYHGAGLAVCATYERLPAGPAIAGIFRKEPLAGWVLTQLYVWIGWLVFFYPASIAWQMAKQLVGL
jgi:alginate O-acetyltransferase complex protein AlgI